MNTDLKNLIVLASSIVGVLAVASSFSSQLDTIEKKGLSLSGGIALIGLGIIFYYRVENTADQAKRLLS